MIDEALRHVLNAIVCSARLSADGELRAEANVTPLFRWTVEHGVPLKDAEMLVERAVRDQTLVDKGMLAVKLAEIARREREEEAEERAEEENGGNQDGVRDPADLVPTQ